MKRSCTGLVLVLAVVLAITSLGAQQPEDTIARHLFPPDLLMKYQREIGLTESQRKTMLDAIAKSQTRFGQQRKLAELRPR